MKGKRLFSFNPIDFTKGIVTPAINFVGEDSPTGFEMDAMLFSTANNRNKAYFQVFSLIKWSNKAEAILHNFNHDLSLTGGRYMGNQTRLIKIWTVEIDGELEIWGKCKTTDPMMIANKSKITAPSIELLVDEKDIISNENGEYFIDFDWVGIGWLLGIPAGSGDARVSEIKDFSILKQFNMQDNTPENTPENPELPSAEVQTPTPQTEDDKTEYKFFSKKKQDFLYVDLGSVVCDSITQTPGVLMALNLNKGNQNFTVELFDGSTKTYTISKEDEDSTLEYCSTGEAMLYLARKINLTPQQANSSAEDEEIERNLKAFKVAEEAKKQEALKTFANKKDEVRPDEKPADQDDAEVVSSEAKATVESIYTRANNKLQHLR